MRERQPVTDDGVQNLTAQVERLSAARVLCVGDVMLDRFVNGAVDRVSPEAPIPVLRVEHETEMLGGVGNVGRNAASLGVRATILAAVGDDNAGRRIKTLTDADPLLAAIFAIESSRPTTVKTRYVSGAQQLLRADSETTAALSDGSISQLETAYHAALPDHDVVVLSDYAKGVLSDPLITRLIDGAAAAGKPVIADPKSTKFQRYKGVTLLTPNLGELAAAAGQACDDDDAIVAAAKDWIARAGVGAILVTRGKQGMTLVTGTGDATHLATDAREVFDVSGAGDTVIATLAAALGAGADLAEAARLANLAAGVVVAKAGTATVYPSELVQAVHAEELQPAGGKIFDFQPALDRIARWRRAGDRIGFTNGCFDLIHPGHVSLFNQAQAACDRLVVGLNTDASVARLKGPDRPAQDQHARATVLSALGAVDMVVLFDEDTPINLIEAIRPDVLVKGADYTLDQVVGGDFVRSIGGQVLLADIAAGHSTSDTLLRLAGTGSNAE